jgi:hypothetical protein
VSGWGWAAVILIGWMVISFVTAPLVGKWLRRNSAYYPEPPLAPSGAAPRRGSPPGSCVEPDQRRGPST